MTRALQLRGTAGDAWGTVGGGRHRTRVPHLLAALVLAWAMALSMSPVAAHADDVDLTPGPTVVADSDSPTGYTGHFVYYDPDATSVRFVADILLRNWADPTDPTIYQPSQYRPGLMRGGGAYDVEMTNAGDGYWVTDVPLAAGANQYWFYVDDDTSLWVTDPANSPIYAPDGLTGTARRAFNKVNVPYDAEKQNYAPMAAREIENPRPDSAKGTWSYVPIQIGTTTRTMGVYLPPGYDPNRAEPYKTIYMQHGGGQDQSDWMNIGSVPVIMDNLIQDGSTEPAVVITTATNYLGSPAEGYPNLRNVVIPFVESHYNVSTRALDRAFAGLSAGSIVTANLINHDPTAFGYYGPWSGGMRVDNATPNLAAPYILFGGGAWDFGLPNPAQVAALDNAVVENVVVSGAHDFNAWNQLFTTFARDYLWHPEAFLADEISVLKESVASTSLNRGNRNALTAKLDRAYELLTRDSAGTLGLLEAFVAQVHQLEGDGKLTDEQAAELVGTAEKVIVNVGYWQ
ncbi:alpha/beta hydrolase [Jiangella rhizosphaerae]|uniref:alpha/beta hydrolase n=1 Tax=Jiangella rhizosphaerae TaxID=2293569 RepID=UPI0018F4CBFF|nr:alpha/beta hydrolase-fold protein [Jiangella rhizosphaerae]